MIKTNMGVMPVIDYLEIVAIQNGFDSYADMKANGFYVDTENLLEKPIE